MASVAMLLKTYLLFNLIVQLRAETLHLPAISPQLVNISDQWQKNNLVYQEKFIQEVIVKQGLENLHLVCMIEPPLPQTEEHFNTRNDLVKFEKLYPEKYAVDGIRYWSDDQRMTAIALNTKTIGLFGMYSCSYGHIKKTVEVLAENNGVLKDFPRPKTLEEMFSFSFVKNNTMSYDNKMHPTGRNITFHCPDTKSEKKATSVHKLKPSAIGVVATIGDSITVGLGAKAGALPHFFTEYRGLSWSNGGDLSIEDVVTLPNILKRFNPNLRGYSLGNSRHIDKRSGFNMATISSTTSSLAEQVKDLVHKIQEDKKINFEEDWKLVTIMIGSRDLCRLCYGKVVSPDNYVKFVMNALDTLQAELPRTFVNLVLPLNVTRLETFFKNGDCLIQNWSICPCLQDESMREKISNFFQGYKKLVYELVNSGLYDRKDDFTVVIQPLFEDWSFTEQERDLFTLDCFHLSTKGNSLAATTLWNNMVTKEIALNPDNVYFPPTKFEPYLVTTNVSEVEPLRNKIPEKSNNLLKCLPKEFPYFFTQKNSEWKSEKSPKIHQGLSDEIIVAISLSIISVVFLISAFVFVKHKLRTPVEKLHFNNIIKYYI